MGNIFNNFRTNLVQIYFFLFCIQNTSHVTSNTSLLKKTTSQSRDLRHNCGNTLFVSDLERTLEHSQQQARQTEMGHNYFNYRMDSVGLWNYSIELALKQILIFLNTKTKWNRFEMS